MRRARTASKLPRREAGAAMAEFALIAPLLLMLLLGVVGLGWALYTYNFVADAASQAVRYAIVRGADCNSWGSACPASAADIQDYVQSLVPAAINAADVTATTTWTPDNSPGSNVKVTVTYSFTLSIPLMPDAVLPMQSAAQMVISQ